MRLGVNEAVELSLGEMSEGMILAVRDSDNLALISPTREKIAGSLIS
ncbi:hypothetical protein JP0131_14790 [Helicobacter pylori]|nr:hypothetical protein [Helicobacter pylori]GHP20240.1 hypothetical protein JP0131_14790 [Helicobacter pylori]